MWRIHSVLILVVAATLTVAPMALAQGIVPNPVVNPGFEASLPEAEPLHGTPADECIGIGHQVFYGSDTPQARAEGAAEAAQNGDASGAEENASGAAGHVDSPGEAQEEALFQVGYGNCVWSDEEGKDIAWINPVRLAGDDAVHWSGHDDDKVADVDGDGDREIAIPADAGHHNFWQAWPSPFQAFTGNFEALEFDVEDGSVSDNTLVQVSFSATPMDNQTTELVLFRDCAINFPGTLINANTDSEGHVAVPPTEAGFTSTGDEHCEDLAAAWQDADDEERRDILGRLRVVQLSFWGFERAPEDAGCGCTVQLDNIALSHATTVAEEAASGNVVVGPDLLPDEAPE